MANTDREQMLVSYCERSLSLGSQIEDSDFQGETLPRFTGLDCIYSRFDNVQDAHYTQDA